MKPNKILNLAQLAASLKLAASYLTKKQIKFWTNLVRILITQPQVEKQAKGFSHSFKSKKSERLKPNQV